MINQPKNGIEPDGYRYSTPARHHPGVFLDRESAHAFFRELGAKERAQWRLLRRHVRAAHWRLELFVAVRREVS